MKKYLRNLRNKPQEHRLRVSFLATLMAAAVLAPLWFWNTGQTGLLANSSSRVQTEDQGNFNLSQTGHEIAGAFSDLSNPLKKLDEGLEQKFTRPVKVKSVETEDNALLVTFEAENSTFDDLVVPTARISLTSAAGEIVLEKVSTPEGQTLSPLVAAGKTRTGVLQFPQVLNGHYVLTFSGLRYQGEAHGEFEQSLNVEVTDSWKPRS